MESRIKKLEVVTERLMRRARKKATGLITPYPISNAVIGEKVEGTILRYMFPCEGTIVKGMVRFNKKPKQWNSINIKVFGDTNSFIKGFTVEKKKMAVALELNVEAGDCMEIAVKSSSEDTVEEVWISFLWVPAVKEVTAKSFLIAELENDLLER